MFSSRVPGDLVPNAVAVAVERMRLEGRGFADLTVSNPTVVGIEYPPDLLAPLSDPQALRYDPQPFGLSAARQAISADYARRGVRIPHSQIVLTASTSESYGLLFKILCDPGASVLVPTPSYPLFEHLTRLENVRAIPYRTEFHGTWAIDPDDVRQLVDGSTRALLVVSPNNPTGAWLKRDELRALEALCAEHRLVLISDEVFADYPIDPAPGAVASVIDDEPPILSISLGGLSKSVGLPQLKLGWMALRGPSARVQAALIRLEVAADAYLSVSTPVQLATAWLLDRGRAVRHQIRRRVTSNYRMLPEIAATAPWCQVLRAEGGWSAVLRIPHTMPEDERVIRLLEEQHVLVHPGYFFDFPREGYLVVSLLTRPDIFRPALERLVTAVGRT
ncbi:MAG TPA: pyridoxal phosphate-dependent aminotransferase [Vicinamibacterales bacterium]